MTDFIDVPRRMNEIWDWVVAFDAYDYGDRGPLAELLATTDTVPHEAARQLALVVSGERKPNMKAAAKLKVPASERMKIAGTVSLLVGLHNVIRTRARNPIGDGNWERAIDTVADRKGRETIDVARDLQARARKQIVDAASQLEVSVETVENLLRDLRKKIAAFPII